MRRFDKSISGNHQFKFSLFSFFLPNETDPSSSCLVSFPPPSPLNFKHMKQLPWLPYSQPMLCGSLMDDPHSNSKCDSKKMPRTFKVIDGLCDLWGNDFSALHSQPPLGSWDRDPGACPKDSSAHLHCYRDEKFGELEKKSNENQANLSKMNPVSID